MITEATDETSVTITTTRTTGYKNKPVAYAYGFIQAEITKKQYSQRLKMFFDHIKLEGSDIEEQGQNFLEFAKGEGGQQWVQESIFYYLEHHKERVKAPKREISACSNSFSM